MRIMALHNGEQTMRDLTIKLNGKVHGYCQTMDDAEEVAETLWMQGKGHTQVVDEVGDVVCEFEV
jgi:hypothetical protein